VPLANQFFERYGAKYNSRIKQLPVELLPSPATRGPATYANWRTQSSGS
jgi:hypothetical protein